MKKPICALSMLLLKYSIAAGLLHTYVHETYSITLIQYLSLLWQTTFKTVHHDPKVGIKSCRDARECVSFMYAYI